MGAPLEEVGLAIFALVSLKIEGRLGKDARYGQGFSLRGRSGSRHKAGGHISLIYSIP
jgi:hypothetical protein